MEKELKDIQEKGLNDIANASTVYDLEGVKTELLGKKGKLTNILKQMGSLQPELRKTVGSMANVVRVEIEQAYENRKVVLVDMEITEKMNNEKMDVTQVKGNVCVGHEHIISQTFKELEDIFVSMGFEVREGPEIEYTKFNFDMLNTPLDHPARDIQDTLYIDDSVILRTHTSPVQARSMLNTKPPIKMIVPGRVYRSDAADATHSPMFHQLEGLVVGENVTLGDLKGTLEEFAKKVFGEDTKIRLRPHFFPFTEPSVEVDVSCFICKGEGCSLCKKDGYIEILGGGMVHPNVLENCGIDSNKYTGFAFGFGIERIAMIKNKIADMRLLFENDTRFLEQF